MKKIRNPGNLGPDRRSDPNPDLWHKPPEEMKAKQSSEKYTWKKFRTDMEEIFADINEDRKALAYYKQEQVVRLSFILACF